MAKESLSVGKKDKAENHLFDAKEHLEREITEI